MRLITAMLTALVMTGLVSASAHAAFPGHNGELAFVRIDHIDQEVYAVPPGDPPVHLRQGFEPAFSPDGRLIVCRCDRVRRGDEVRGTVVMAADGSRPVEVGNLAMNDPSFSADGTRIAGQLFFPQDDDDRGIWIMDADGANPEQLTTKSDREPVFSPDGQRIAFARDSQSGRNIFDMAVDGSDVRRLTNLRNAFSPDFSPDGTQIVFSASDFSSSGHEALALMDADGQNSQALFVPDSAGRALTPVFSPEGSEVAFELGSSTATHPYAGSHVYAFRLGSVPKGSSPLRQLISITSWGPAWQPVPSGGVDLVPPGTVMTERPGNRGSGRKVVYRFLSTEAASRFECRLDKQAYEACSSPLRFRNLDPGKHLFRVKAIDEAGHVDPTPRLDRFRVGKGK
jgi:hypothetical protein